MKDFMWHVLRLCAFMLLLVSAALQMGARQTPLLAAYEAEYRGRNYELHLLDVRHKLSFRLTQTPYNERHPAWSPDGRYIAFSSDASGNWEIYLLDANNLSAPSLQITHDHEKAMRPAWHPDGTQIAFDTTRDGNTEIYLMNIDIDRIQQTDVHSAKNWQRVTYAVGTDEGAAWSPDGTKIAFSSYRDSDLEINIFDLATNTTTNITDNLMHNEWSASWHPANTSLTFASTRTMNWQIFRLDTTALDQEIIQMTHIPIDIAGAVWSPDGKWMIAEVYDTLGSRSLFLLPGTQTGIRLRDMHRLTSGDTDDRYVTWKPVP